MTKAISQTDWITVYSVLPEEGSRLKFMLNIIDTPGFGDTRGPERDNKIVTQIRELISADRPKGILFIDAVCFLTKASDARMVAAQRNIFNSIAALFGKDIYEYICTLVTFADDKRPPVLAALKESKLPFGDWFTFNNTALVADNEKMSMSNFSSISWEMGCESFRNFFDKLEKLRSKSLQMTTDVLQQRHALQSIIQKLQPQVEVGLRKLLQLQSELQILEQNKTEIDRNRDFEYELEETRLITYKLPKGKLATNCLQCNVTCHKDCICADDMQKIHCSAMDGNGNCRVCSSHCNWTQHKNTPYIFEYVTEKVKKKYAEKLKKYEEATGKKLSHENVVNKMIEDLDNLMFEIETMMEQVNSCNNTLRQIALRPNPLTMTEHIDMMIESEKMEKRAGFEDRIKMLQNFRRNAEIRSSVDVFYRDMEDSRNQVYSSTGRKPLEKGKLFERQYNAFKSLFS